MSPIKDFCITLVVGGVMIVALVFASDALLSANLLWEAVITAFTNLILTIIFIAGMWVKATRAVKEEMKD